MKKSRLLGAVCAVLFTFITVSANAALVSRLSGAAAYDDVLDITWLTDADLSGNNSWDNQLTWVAGLNTANHLGFNDWRLASMSVAAGLPTGTTTSVFNCSTSPPTTEQACRDNELGYMYWQNMGGTGGSVPGDQTVDGVLLRDVQVRYWSGTEFNSSDAWRFNYRDGTQDTAAKFNVLNMNAWAVRAGDSVVPVPGAVWLFGSGLVGLLGLARRKR